jgi:hypothetical protein
LKISLGWAKTTSPEAMMQRWQATSLALLRSAKNDDVLKAVDQMGSPRKGL